MPHTLLSLPKNCMIANCGVVAMPPFKIVSYFRPTGDQPQAVDRLVARLEHGCEHQMLERIGTAEDMETRERSSEELSG